MQNHFAKGPVENAILESGMEYMFLQPAIFFQNYAAAGPRVAQTGVFGRPYSAERPSDTRDNVNRSPGGKCPERIREVDIGSNRPWGDDSLLGN